MQAFLILTCLVAVPPQAPQPRQAPPVRDARQCVCELGCVCTPDDNCGYCDGDDARQCCREKGASGAATETVSSYAQSYAQPVTYAAPTPVYYQPANNYVPQPTRYVQPVTYSQPVQQVFRVAPPQPVRTYQPANYQPVQQTYFAPANYGGSVCGPGGCSPAMSSGRGGLFGRRR